jgi:REP element-mobilizing transposase RayT
MHLGRKKWQPSGGVIRDFYERAKEVLKYPVLTFSFDEFAIVGAAFADVIRAQRYTCYACAAMPDHVHILIRKHKHKAEEMSERLKDASRDALLGQGVAAPDHPIWTVGGWHKFLDHPDDIRHDIEYIRNNPAERGLPDQLWSFVQAYDGWPHHARS